MIYRQCDMAMKSLVLLSYYCAYFFFEISLDCFALSLLLLVLPLTRFHSGLYWILILSMQSCNSKLCSFLELNHSHQSFPGYIIVLHKKISGTTYIMASGKNLVHYSVWRSSRKIQDSPLFWIWFCIPLSLYRWGFTCGR